MGRSDSSGDRSRHKKNKKKNSRSSSSSNEKRKHKAPKNGNNLRQDYSRLGRYETKQNRQKFNRERVPQRPRQKGATQKIQIVLTKPQSDIKDLKIDYHNIAETCQNLSQQLSQNVGPVLSLQQVSSKRGSVTLGLGFKYDSDAMSYYTHVNEGMKLQIKQAGQTIKLNPQPTEVFRCFMPFLTDPRKNNQKEIQNQRHQRLQRVERNTPQQFSRAQKNRDSQSSSQQKRNKHSRHHRRRSSSSPSQKRETQKSRQSYNNQNYYRKGLQNQNFKKVMIFGISTSIKSIQITNFLNNTSDGPFQSKSFIWKRMRSSISQYLELVLETSKAQKFVAISDKVDIKGNPFIAIICQDQDQNQILNRIRQFEVNIQFPCEVSPYHVLKGIKNCGRVIQIVSNNNLTQKFMSSSYCITFNSKIVASQLKKIGKLSSGIKIQELDRGQLVYRPTSKRELFKSSQNS